MGGLTGVTWAGTVVTMAIQPHIQVYMTIWLATLVSTFTSVAMWMTAPDHGALNRLRLSNALLRLEGAISEEAAADEETEPARRTGRLESVA